MVVVAVVAVVVVSEEGVVGRVDDVSGMVAANSIDVAAADGGDDAAVTADICDAKDGGNGGGKASFWTGGDFGSA